MVHPNDTGVFMEDETIGYYCFLYCVLLSHQHLLNSPKVSPIGKINRYVLTTQSAQKGHMSVFK
jgi:hypothetical protein